jgi:carboxymethylenebutenolidase
VRTLPEASGKVGVIGFCLGGLLAYLTAARQPVDAAVAYYGGNTDQHLDEAGGVHRPLLMHLGEQDEFISAAAQRAIVDALAGNPSVEIHRYPGCSHAFARRGGLHYDAAAAALANARTLAFFRRHLASA